MEGSAASSVLTPTTRTNPRTNGTKVIFFRSEATSADDFIRPYIRSDRTSECLVWCVAKLFHSAPWITCFASGAKLLFTFHLSAVNTPIITFVRLSVCMFLYCIKQEMKGFNLFQLGIQILYITILFVSGQGKIGTNYTKTKPDSKFRGDVKKKTP